MEDSEDNVPLKELVRKESAQPENVSATETKCYEEYIMKRNERLQTNQDETVREKSAPKGKHGITKGKTDPKDKAILDLKDITKQHQTSGAKEGASKRKLDMTCVQSGKADPPQPGQPLDFLKRHRQVSISSDLEDVPLQQLDDEDDDYEDLGGIWENEIDYRTRPCISCTFFHKIEAKIEGAAYPWIHLCLEFSNTYLLRADA